MIAPSRHLAWSVLHNAVCWKKNLSTEGTRLHLTMCHCVCRMLVTCRRTWHKGDISFYANHAHTLRSVPNARVFCRLSQIARGGAGTESQWGRRRGLNTRVHVPTHWLLGCWGKQVGPGGIWRPKGNTSGSIVLERGKRGQETSREETGLQAGSISKTL